MANKYNAKLTDEVSARLCEAIIKGHSIEAACGYADISKPTFYNWYNRGETARSGKYRQFYWDIENAKDKASLFVESVIIDSIPDNPKDAKWWLTKRRPDTYGDRTFTEAKVEADVKTELLTKLERPLPELEDDDECT